MSIRGACKSCYEHAELRRIYKTCTTVLASLRIIYGVVKSSHSPLKSNNIILSVRSLTLTLFSILSGNLLLPVSSDRQPEKRTHVIREATFKDIAILLSAKARLILF